MTAMHRRDFLTSAAAVSGAMVLGFWLPPSAVGAGLVPDEPWHSGTSKGPEINAWLTIAPDDTVTIRVAQTDVGTGVFTTCSMMIAEELQCDWSKVRAEYASANRNVREKAPAWTIPVPGNGLLDPAGGGEPVQLKGEDGVYRRMSTGSSGAVRESRYYLQQAGAEARERLLLAAAREWDVPVSELAAKDSVVTHKTTGRKTTYGKLAAKAAQLALPDPEQIKIKTPDQFTLMGTEQRNLDVPLKVTGAATFGIDIRLPRMLYAAAKACPVWQGGVKSYDFDAIKQMPGVHSVVALPAGPQLYSGGVAVVADSWWRAKTALDAMPIEWDYGRHGNVNSDDLYKDCFAAFENGDRTKTLVDYGNIDAGFARASKIVEATYQLPYLSHMCMEPGNATAVVTADRVELWCGTQEPSRALDQASQLTGVRPENVYVNTTFVGGGFGGRGGWGSTGAMQITQVLRIAQTLNGRPVKLLWTREEDLRVGDSYRPAGVSIFRAALDAEGWPIAVHVRSAGDHAEVRGLVEMPYFTPNYRYEMSQTAPFHVPSGPRRGTGTSLNAFYMESFVDELAHAAGRDLYRYRRELISRNPPEPARGIGGFRFRDDWLKILDLAAEMSGWGTELPKGWARSIVIDDRRRPERHTVTVCAQVHTISVSPAGKIRLHRVDVAFDEGFGFVNPLSVRKQIEGQIAFGYSDALYQAVTIKDGRAVEGNFNDYPTSRMEDYPREVNIAFVKTNRWLEGVGEEAMSLVAPALANAVFQVTGKRIRSLPFKNHDLSWG
jgi:isoquinoline 1-oxidoreductase subunit beta